MKIFRSTIFIIILIFMVIPSLFAKSVIVLPFHNQANVNEFPASTEVTSIIFDSTYPVLSMIDGIDIIDEDVCENLEWNENGLQEICEDNEADFAVYGFYQFKGSIPNVTIDFYVWNLALNKSVLLESLTIPFDIDFFDGLDVMNEEIIEVILDMNISLAQIAFSKFDLGGNEVDIYINDKLFDTTDSDDYSQNLKIIAGSEYVIRVINADTGTEILNETYNLEEDDYERISVTVAETEGGGYNSIIYVSETGSPDNTGTSADSPVSDLQTAVNLAEDNYADAIRIHGSFSSGYGMTLFEISDLNISGGWNESFNEQTDTTVIDGGDRLKHVVRMEYCEDIVLTNITVTGGFANDQTFPDTCGGGIFGDYVTNCEFYCVLEDNYAMYGGGIYLRNAAYNYVAGIITNNEAGAWGGGVYLTIATDNEIEAKISGNSAMRGGGISFTSSCYRNAYENSTYSQNMPDDFYDQRKEKSYFLSEPVEIDTIYVSENGETGNTGLSANSAFASLQKGIDVAGKTGAGEIKIHGNPLLGKRREYGVTITATNLTISGGWNTDFSEQDDTTLLNSDMRKYHCIQLVNCDNVTLTNFVITGGNANQYNFPATCGGGIFGDYVYNSQIYCTISNNFAMYGGGIYLRYANNNTIDSKIIDNEASHSGGGIYLNYCENNIILGTITNNTARIAGGGIQWTENCKNNDYENAVISGNTPDDLTQ